MITIPLYEFHQYHEINRELFARLVVLLARNPADSILVMSFWLWLESHNFPCIVTRLLKASDFMVNKLADEAQICLNSLAADQGRPAVNQTAFTRAVIGNAIPLEIMHADKSTTIDSIKYFITDVCARIFTDILDRLIGGNPANRQYYQPLNVPGFPHPIFGDVTILKLPFSEEIPVDDLWGWDMNLYNVNWVD